MRLLRRNTSEFTYRPYTGETETMVDGTIHTGEYKAGYGTPVKYRGNISTPSGYATDNLFGKDTRYTHVLLMNNPQTAIDEYGLIEWRGETYEVNAVRKSLNVLAAALRKKTRNNAPVVTDEQNDNG